MYVDMLSKKETSGLNSGYYYLHNPGWGGRGAGEEGMVVFTSK